jgi:hypothetical protein
MKGIIQREHLWQKRPGQAFKNVALIFSFIVNFVLLIVLLLLLPHIVPILNGTAVPIVDGLSESFIEMNQATITRTISVEDTVPVNLDIELSTSTVVTLTEDVVLGNYPITLVFPGGGGHISGSVTLVLPTGLSLPVQLNLGVPVRDQIPVNLAVEVSIPLTETQLSTPFARLENLFSPLADQLDQLPKDNDAALRLVLPE